MAQNELRERMNDLKALRDEVAVKIHLGELDAKTRWEALRPKIDEVELQAAKAGDTAITGVLTAVETLRTALREIKSRLDSRTHS